MMRQTRVLNPVTTLRKKITRKELNNKGERGQNISQETTKEQKIRDK